MNRICTYSSIFWPLDTKFRFWQCQRSKYWAPIISNKVFIFYKVRSTFFMKDSNILNDWNTVSLTRIVFYNSIYCRNLRSFQILHFISYITKTFTSLAELADILIPFIKIQPTLNFPSKYPRKWQNHWYYINTYIALTIQYTDLMMFYNVLIQYHLSIYC